jgi:hypothetical protein
MSFLSRVGDFGFSSGASCAIRPSKGVRVPSGEDRSGEHHVLGVSSTNCKVSTQESSDGLFIMEHTNKKKGGPPRHCTTRRMSAFTL